MRLPNLCSRVSSVLAVFGLAASAVAQTPAPRTFSNYYFFGDSLTDSGNTFALTGSPPAPYFQGRVSNGITFAEYLAPGLAVATTTSANAPRLNFAFAGATAAPGSAVPNLGLQVAQYQARGITANANGLYVLLAGANDLLNAIQVPANQSSTAMNATGVTASTAVTSAVSSLAGLGAKNILVLNLPDISRTPRFTTGSGASGALFMQTGVLTYNRDIATRLAGLNVASDVRVTLVDLASVFNQIIANPQRFGFTIANQEYVGVLQSGANPGDVNNYIFWDGIHPTTKTHALFAQVLTEVVNPEFVLGTASTQGTALLAASDLSADALASRLDGVRSSGLKREGAHGWVSYSGKEGNFDAVTYQNAFDVSSSVMAAGFDASIGHGLVAGLAVTKESVSADLAAAAGAFKLEGQNVAAYVQWKSGNLFADATASFGSHDVRNIARRTLLSGLMTSAKTKGERWGASARVGLDLGGDMFHVTPFAGLRYTKGSLDAYSETGVSGLNFAYDEQTAKQVDGLVGATADWQIAGGSMPLFLGVSAVYQNDLADDTRFLSGRLADTVAARSSVSIADGLDQTIKLGARLGGTFSKRWGWAVGYTADLRNNGDQGNQYSVSLQTGF